MKSGDPVHVFWDGWRTGVYLDTVERGKSFGLRRVKLNFVSGDPILVAPDDVKLIIDLVLEAMLE